MIKMAKQNENKLWKGCNATDCLGFRETLCVFVDDGKRIVCRKALW
jgi:hypothetical protein